VFWIRSSATAPAATAIGRSSQVRARTRVTVIAAVPSAPLPCRSTVNSVSPTVTPHGAPTIATSTV
jgi:hypothetical protein